MEFTLHISFVKENNDKLSFSMFVIRSRYFHDNLFVSGNCFDTEAYMYFYFDKRVALKLKHACIFTLIKGSVDIHFSV